MSFQKMKAGVYETPGIPVSLGPRLLHERSIVDRDLQPVH